MLMMFQVCFFVGVGISLISLIVGNIFHITGLDGCDMDVDVDIDFDIGHGIFLPISPLVIVLFVTIFGGSGMILINSFGIPEIFILLISAVIGMSISLFINRIVFIPLKRAQNTSAPELEELIGILAKINESIGETGFGEINYVVNGNSYNAPAKSTDGKAIMKGTEVSVCWIEDHVFYVTSVEDKFN